MVPWDPRRRSRSRASEIQTHRASLELTSFQERFAELQKFKRILNDHQRFEELQGRLMEWTTFLKRLAELQKFNLILKESSRAATVVARPKWCCSSCGCVNCLCKGDCSCLYCIRGGEKLIRVGASVETVKRLKIVIDKRDL